MKKKRKIYKRQTLFLSQSNHSCNVQKFNYLQLANNIFEVFDSIRISAVFSRRPQPVTTMNPSHALRGVDNPGMERVDMVDLEDPTSGGVFATDTSLLTNGMNGRKFTHPALPVFVLLPW